MKDILKIWVGLTAILVMAGVAYLIGWWVDGWTHGYWTRGSGHCFWVARTALGTMFGGLGALVTYILGGCAWELGSVILGARTDD